VYHERIRALYDQFSPGYRRIADYVLEHYQDAAFMTAAEIARNVQVDTALVVRFAQRLGYPGFPELIEEVQDDVKQDLRKVYEPPEGDNAPVHVFRRNLLQDRNNIDYLLLHLDDEVVLRVVDLLASAPRIFVGGEGSSAYLAEAFVLRLLSLGLPAHAINIDLPGQAAIASSVRPSDVFVGIGMTALTPGVAVLLKSARSLGAQTIGIMASVTHPIASAAEHILHAPVRTVGVAPSWTALACVLHALTQTLAECRAEPTQEWIERTDTFTRSYADALRQQLVSTRDSIAEYTAMPLNNKVRGEKPS
jgi:DNA-binding MurR/RpiR family transcriptional regulator